MRRILEFWKDKENALVKSQIDQFLNQYPKSEYGDSLQVILGDIYWLEKNYKQALTAYQNIIKPQFQDKVFNNCLDCLYHLSQYQQVQQKLEGKILNELEQISDEQQALWIYKRGSSLKFS